MVALLIEPATVAEVYDVTAMWASALLTAPFGTLKTDHFRELMPVDRIEPALFGADRHGGILNH